MQSAGEINAAESVVLAFLIHVPVNLHTSPSPALRLLIMPPLATRSST